MPKRAMFALLLIALFLAGIMVGKVVIPQGAAARAGAPLLPPHFLDGVPDVRQSTNYSCGASVLQAVLAYWGTSEREDRLMARLGTKPLLGAGPEAIVRVARDYGLEAELREGLDLEDLEATLKTGTTVIVNIQAWREGQGRPWAETWEDGHYVILLGADAANLYFEDPSLLGSRGFIPRSEFLDRWHDYEGEPPLDDADRKFVHTAIFVRGEHPAPRPPLEPLN